MMIKALQEFLLSVYFGRLKPKKGWEITLGFDEQTFELLTRELRESFNKFGLVEMKKNEVKSTEQITKWKTMEGTVTFIKLPNEERKPDTTGAIL